MDSQFSTFLITPKGLLVGYSAQLVLPGLGRLSRGNWYKPVLLRVET